MLPPQVTTIVTQTEPENDSNELQELREEVDQLQNRETEIQESIRSADSESRLELLREMSEIRESLKTMHALIQQVQEELREATTVTEIEMEEPQEEVTILETENPVVTNENAPAPNAKTDERGFLHKILFG